MILTCVLVMFNLAQLHLFFHVLFIYLSISCTDFIFTLFFPPLTFFYLYCLGSHYLISLSLFLRVFHVFSLSFDVISSSFFLYLSIYYFLYYFTVYFPPFYLFFFSSSSGPHQLIKLQLLPRVFYLFYFFYYPLTLFIPSSFLFLPFFSTPSHFYGFFFVSFEGRQNHLIPFFFNSLTLFHHPVYSTFLFPFFLPLPLLFTFFFLLWFYIFFSIIIISQCIFFLSFSFTPPAFHLAVCLTFSSIFPFCLPFPLPPFSSTSASSHFLIKISSCDLYNLSFIFFPRYSIILPLSIVFIHFPFHASLFFLLQSLKGRLKSKLGIIRHFPFSHTGNF